MTKIARATALPDRPGIGCGTSWAQRGGDDSGENGRFEFGYSEKAVPDQHNPYPLQFPRCHLLEVE